MDAQESLILNSFSPSSGVTFYHQGSTAWRFDLITKENTVVLEDNWSAQQQLEFDQIYRETIFETLDQLRDYVAQEYLHDKKHTYYWLLFTTPLTNAVRKSTLEFLNSSELETLKLRTDYVDALHERASENLVLECIKVATTLGLQRVCICMARELQEITLPVSIRAAKSSALLDTGSLAEPAAGLIAHAENISGKLLSLIQELTTIIETHPTFLIGSALNHITKLALLSQRESPVLKLIEGMARNDWEIIQQSYWRSFETIDTTELMQVWRNFQKVRVTPDEEVFQQGLQILQNSRSRDIGALSIPIWRQYTLPEPSILLSLLIRKQGKAVMAKGAAGVPFSIEFLFSRMAITASSRSKHRYLHSVASWLMMYALLAKGHYVIDPPSHIFRLLYEVPEGWSIFDGWGTWLKKQSKETRPPTLTSQMALYEQINFLSMALFFWSTPDQTRPEDLIDFLRSRLHQFAHYSRARFGETQVHDLPNPSDILISNLHVWALHSGHEEVVRYLKQYQLDTAQHLELWPIVRIIV